MVLMMTMVIKNVSDAIIPVKHVMAINTLIV